MAISTAQTALGTVILGAIGLLYVAPSLLAARRRVAGLPRLLQVNVYLGWTVAGWVYCLAAALHRSPRPGGCAVPPPTQMARVEHDRMPIWVRDLPAHDGTWAALPRDTAPLPLDLHPDSR